MNLLSVILFLGLISTVSAQEIKKENLSKMVHTYWDFNKTSVQSEGKYFVDEFGQTQEKHGKWTYYDKYGVIEEVRHYYRDMLSGEVTLFFPNGKIKQHGFFYLNRQDSSYVEYFETGHKKVEGQYDLDQAVGRWKYFYVDGRLKSVEEVRGEDNYIWEFYLPDSLHTQTIQEGNGEFLTFYSTGGVKEWYNYQNGLKHGPFEEQSIYGYTTLKGEFNEGLKHGEWEYAYYNGKKEKVSNYSKGQLEGPYQYFYDNGTVNVNGQYKNGLKDGVWTWYTNKGTRDMEGSFKNDVQDGDWIYWHPTGEIAYYAHFSGGLKTGQWTYLYKNGQKFKEGSFKDDVRHGNWKTWYEDGTLLMDGDYANGLESGEWKNYWENGQLKNQSTFKNGELNGKWASYFPSGKLKLTGEYKENLQVGEWIDYFENGKPKDLISYKLYKKKTAMDYGITKGRVVYESVQDGKAISYSDKDFKPTEEGEYKQGEKHGAWIAYHPGGKVPAVTSNYSNGKLEGWMKVYDRRGKLLQEMEYKDGLKHGKFLVYDKRGKVTIEKNFEYGMQIIEGTNSGSGSFSPGR
jgi:uncharacterized protein